MAIAFDTSSQSTLSNPVTSKTLSHTCSGTDRILFVNAGLPLTDKITSVSYNGVALTKVATTPTSASRVTSLWYLINPPAGTYTISISASSSDALAIEACSYTGVDQSSPIDVLTTDQDTSTTVGSTSLTTTVDNCWTLMVARSGTNFTAGAGTVVRQTQNGIGIGDSNGPITPAGSTSLTFNAVSTTDIGMVMVAFKPAGGGGGGFTKPNYLGFSRL